MTPDPGDLANLRDLALPTAIPWWPPTFGWWVLAVGLLGIALLLLADGVRRYRRNAYRRAAIRELRALATALSPVLAPAVAAVLKRTALAAYPRGRVAGLTGAGWAGFLSRTGGFAPEASAALRRATVDPSRPLDPPETHAVLVAARAWVRRHRRGGEMP